MVYIQDDERPPEYASLVSRDPSVCSGDETSLPNGVKPVNFLYLTRTNSSINGSYVVDPCLIIPQALLPDVDPGEEMDNLQIHTDVGNIAANIWIFPSTTARVNQLDSTISQQRVRLSLRADNGSITAAMNVPLQTLFFLTCKVSRGRITVQLPRTFHGTITTRSQPGCAGFSPAVASCTSTFSEVKDKRGHHILGKYFVGGLTAEDDSLWDDGGEWMGDRVEASADVGSLKIVYADEQKPEKNPNWLRRLVHSRSGAK